VEGIRGYSVVTTSGTYALDYPASDIIIHALALAGVDKASILTHHIKDAALQANLLLVDFTNRNPNQWGLETQTQVLTADQAAYTLTARTISVAAAYIETTTGGTTTGRVLGAMSAADYATIPNKDLTGFPSTYVFTLTSPTPTLTLYVVPDAEYTYTLNLLTFRRMQDLDPRADQTIDAPYRFMDAFTWGLAARLARLYDRTRVADLSAQYERAFTLAASADQERVNMTIAPILTGYYR